jgi:hypothetical protein
VVRGTLLRGTQHLVTADDYLAWRPLLQPVMDRFGRGAAGRARVDREALAAAARSRWSWPRPGWGARPPGRRRASSCGT